MADDDMVMIRGSSNTRACTVLLRGANDYMLDEMDRSLHDAFCVVKRVLESGSVVAGQALWDFWDSAVACEWFYVHHASSTARLMAPLNSLCLLFHCSCREQTLDIDCI